MTESELHPYSSRAPVFVVEGRTEGALARDLLRLDIEEGCLGLRTLVAHFHAVGPASDGSAGDLSYLDGEVVDVGRAIEVSMGPPGAERQVFKGTISALEVSFAEGRAPYVSVLAEDAMMRLRQRQRTATYVDKSDSDIVAEIARQHGLDAAAEAKGPTYSMVQQWEESDLAFVRDRALRLNAEVWVSSDDVLHFADREQREGAEIKLVQGDQLIAVDARVDLAGQRTEVQMRGWNDLDVVAVTEAADSSVVAAEVSSGRTGPDVTGGVFTSATLTRSRRDVLTADTARSYAEAEMLRRARGFVSVEGVTAGTADLVPGAKLDLRRVGRPFEGRGYRVFHAHHSYDLTRGHRTRFRAERPAVA